MSYLFRSNATKSRAGISKIALFLLSFVFATSFVFAQDGRAIFNTNCASCHHPIKESTGPALQGIADQVDAEWLYAWVKNSGALIASGDKRANDVYNEYNRIAMPPFPGLSNEDIDAIFEYADSFVDPASVTADGGGGAVVEKKDNTWLYAVITVMLLILVVILSKVNKTLKKISNDQKNIPNKKDVPLFRNKIFITLSTIVLVVLAGYYIVNGGSKMGIQQNYMPEQPIFYSHKVHAGINQINCLYCHAGAESSRQAMIPSVNVCMNCHKQIDEYTGEDLYTYEGKKVDGTAEIQKLYEYAGWDPDLRDYLRDADGEIMAKPIEWVKIHNLPDHVYFNHAQHVSVGNVQCQTCHGPVQDMDEVYQFETLSMGWCVNCHRQTKVDFIDNDYYSIFQKYHDEIKAGTRDGVTVADIGGIDCQKCHY